MCCFYANTGGTITSFVLTWNLVRGFFLLVASVSFKMFPSNEIYKIHLIRKQNQKRKKLKRQNIILTSAPSQLYVEQKCSDIAKTMNFHNNNKSNTKKKKNKDNETKNDDTANDDTPNKLVDETQPKLYIVAMKMMYTFDFFEGHNQGTSSFFGSIADVFCRITFYSYFILAIYLTSITSGSWFTTTATTNNTSSSASSIAVDTVEEYDLGHHSLAFGVTFHFLFITFGYALRGARQGYKGYLSMGASTTGAFGLCCLSTAFKLVTLLDIATEDAGIGSRRCVWFGIVMFVFVGGLNVVLCCALCLVPRVKASGGENSPQNTFVI